MNHPPQVQIDNFGVWALELDFSIQIENGQPRAVVGHDGPDDEVTCWGRHLTDFLFMIREWNNGGSLRYPRPTLDEVETAFSPDEVGK